VFSMFYGETIVTKTIDYQASFLILNGTAVSFTLNFIHLPIFIPMFSNKIIKSSTTKKGMLPTISKSGIH
ncbi:MAG: hypothetical protein ABW087_10695, partial [Candidatus Thiodiazotropha sp.]